MRKHCLLAWHLLYMYIRGWLWLYMIRPLNIQGAWSRRMHFTVGVSVHAGLSSEWDARLSHLYGMFLAEFWDCRQLQGRYTVEPPKKGTALLSFLQRLSVSQRSNKMGWNISNVVKFVHQLVCKIVSCVFLLSIRICVLSCHFCSRPWPLPDPTALSSLTLALL